MTITLTREEAQNLLVALEELNRFSIGEDAISLPAEIDTAMEILEAGLAQTEPEPVAWRFDQAKYRENDLRGRQWAFNAFSQTKPYMDEMVRNVMPLYSAPPQREWQGLTKDEINNWDLPDSPTVYEFAQFVEAKLKEKNGA